MTTLDWEKLMNQLAVPKWEQEKVLLGYSSVETKRWRTPSILRSHLANTDY